MKTNKMNDYKFDALIKGLEEEVGIVRKVVRDDDTNCILRDARKERLRTLEWVIEYLERTKEWDWGFL